MRFSSQEEAGDGRWTESGADASSRTEKVGESGTGPTPAGGDEDPPTNTSEFSTGNVVLGASGSLVPPKEEPYSS